MAIKLINVTVTAKVAKFRRIGQWFGDSPKEIEVTPEELAILQGEQMLFVSINDAPKGAKNEAT